MSVSKVSVDLNARTFDIEVPSGDVEPVLALLTNLFSQLPPSFAPRPVAASLEVAPSIGPTEEASEEHPPEDQKPKRKRATGKGGTKVKAPELVDLQLTQEQRQEISAFFAEKAPVGQNDQVAVLGVMLKKFLGKSEFNIDEIHSAFKIVQKPTPRNLIAVFGNMKRDGKAGYANSCLVVNSYTEDHVNFHMKPEKKGEN